MIDTNSAAAAACKESKSRYTGTWVSIVCYHQVAEVSGYHNEYTSSLWCEEVEPIVRYTLPSTVPR